MSDIKTLEDAVNEIVNQAPIENSKPFASDKPVATNIVLNRLRNKRSLTKKSDKIENVILEQVRKGEIDIIKTNNTIDVKENTKINTLLFEQVNKEHIGLPLSNIQLENNANKDDNVRPLNIEEGNKEKVEEKEGIEIEESVPLTTVEEVKQIIQNSIIKEEEQQEEKKANEVLQESIQDVKCEEKEKEIEQKSTPEESNNTIDQIKVIKSNDDLEQQPNEKPNNANSSNDCQLIEQINEAITNEKQIEEPFLLNEQKELIEDLDLKPGRERETERAINDFIESQAIIKKDKKDDETITVDTPVNEKILINDNIIPSIEYKEEIKFEQPKQQKEEKKTEEVLKDNCKREILLTERSVPIKAFSKPKHKLTNRINKSIDENSTSNQKNEISSKVRTRSNEINQKRKINKKYTITTMSTSTKASMPNTNTNPNHNHITNTSNETKIKPFTLKTPKTPRYIITNGFFDRQKVFLQKVNEKKLKILNEVKNKELASMIPIKSNKSNNKKQINATIKQHLNQMSEWEQKRQEHIRELKNTQLAQLKQKEKEDLKYKGKGRKHPKHSSIDNYTERDCNDVCFRLYKEDQIKRKEKQDYLEKIYRPSFKPLLYSYITNSPHYNKKNQTTRNGNQKHFNNISLTIQQCSNELNQKPKAANVRKRCNLSQDDANNTIYKTIGTL